MGVFLEVVRLAGGGGEGYGCKFLLCFSMISRSAMEVAGFHLVP